MEMSCNIAQYKGKSQTGRNHNIHVYRRGKKPELQGMGSRKFRLLENPSREVQGGGGSEKLEFYRKSMKLNWNFLGGLGVQNKKLPLGENGYFLKLH